ncbi:MAG TPA: divalent metal cation transporter [Candidatus Dormibacteraeota bacterium]|nr:divalent metal cation transporter [Candidatus Dormibacteraeota bacterium]
MTDPDASTAREAAAALAPPGRGRLGPGVRVRVRGRSVNLRGIRRPPRGILAFLAIVGPGLVTGAAGNDAGGIATYSQVGAELGYGLLWALVLSTVSLAVAQEMAARLGAATGRGLVDLVRERFGLGWALLATGALLVGNGALTISEFLGIGAAAELLGMSRLVAVPLAAGLVWFLVVRGAYERTERLFLAMTLVFFAYPVAAVLAAPAPADVAAGLVPSIRPSGTWLLLLVGMLGTTLEPYMQVFQQGMVVEKGLSRQDVSDERIDTYAGAIFSNLMSAFVVVAVAATLYVHGARPLADAADAAKALAPAAGRWAEALFAVGLLGASLLSAAVLPLATAYSVTEAFGLPKGVGLDPRRAPGFFGLFTSLIVVGVVASLIPGLPLITVLVMIQVLNAALMPLVMGFMLVLINDRSLVGDLANGRRSNAVAIATWLALVGVVVAFVGGQLLAAVGVGPFAGG